MVFLLMGVSGCGKSAVGEVLAERLGLPFHDADGYHPDANRRKMAAGQPLTDADRRPWLEALAEHIRQWNAEGGGSGGAVLACSALKQAYRQTLAKHGGVTIIHLTGPRELIAQRLADRAGHFFPPDLLDSQLKTLEPPRNAIDIPVGLPIDHQVDKIVQAIGTRK